MVEPGTVVRLQEADPGDTGEYEKKENAEKDLSEDRQALSDLQELFYADGRRAMLIVLQAMDTGGKDGTIRHVMSGVNPQGVSVVSFKQPTPDELAHDYLWRIHRAVPAKGKIGIFNRSHYEDVLVVRVHDLVPREVWLRRYEQINEFEKYLTENDVVVLKFFLYVSRDEQKERLEDRLEEPDKRWKFSVADLAERKRWDEYIRAYNDVLSLTSTPWAPWYLIPGNHKWYRNLAVARTIVRTLQGLDLRYPQPEQDLSDIKIPD